VYWVKRYYLFFIIFLIVSMQLTYFLFSFSLSPVEIRKNVFLPKKSSQAQTTKTRVFCWRSQVKSQDQARESRMMIWSTYYTRYTQQRSARPSKDILFTFIFISSHTTNLHKTYVRKTPHREESLHAFRMMAKKRLHQLPPIHKYLFIRFYFQFNKVHSSQQQSLL